VDNLRRAIEDVIHNNLSFTRAADEYYVPYTTLYDYVRRVKKKEINLSGEKWARCIGCAKWCHELCGGVEDWTSFICDFCTANISKT